MPPGATIIKIYLRQLARDEHGKLRHTTNEDYTEKTPLSTRKLCGQPFEDYMWILSEEWRSWIPQEPKLGQELPAPESVKLRLLRYHLNPRVGFTEGPCFSRATAHDGALVGRVVKISSQSVELEVKGWAKLRLGDDLTFEPHLIGRLIFDRQQQRPSDFTLVALGDVCGHIQHGGYGYRPGKQPLGIACELIRQPKPLDFLPPGGPSVEPDYLQPRSAR
ncbi:hypothetical protein HRbin36_01708 [bacterium HR36]|nr:hypothetical protein HRbin36_01708 [bacterium HR36]